MAVKAIAVDEALLKVLGEILASGLDKPAWLDNISM